MLNMQQHEEQPLPFEQYHFLRAESTTTPDILRFILIRSNKMQQYAGIYLPQNYSACCGHPSHPSSGVHKTVTAASGTGHSI